MATENFSIGPEDGWVQITNLTSVGFIRVRQYPRTRSFYITASGTAPAATFRGQLIDCEEFTCNVATTDDYYVRVVTGGGAPNSDLRIDVFTVESSGSTAGDASAANQSIIIGHIDGIEGSLTTLLGYVDGLEGFSDGIEGLITSTNSLLTTQAGYVDGLEGLLATQAGYLDGLETLIGATNTLLTTQNTYLDGVETLITSTNTKLDTVNTNLGTIDGHVDGIETLIGSTNTLLTTQNTYLDGVETLITSSNTKLDTIAVAVAAATPAGENHIGEVGGRIANPSANFTRPADTTAYASGDLVANSTTAGSVSPLTWATAARVSAGSFMVRRARLKKSGTGVTNASFRLHLYSSSPTVTNGDNGVWLSTHSGYLGSFDFTVDKAFSDAAAGNGVPGVGSECDVALASGQTIYGLLEARAAYTPGNAEVFTVILELIQN